jgi:hypothetical protein
MMLNPVDALVVIGAESHPPDSIVADIAVPLAILVFFGSVYVLVRSNLGTKRGYLVVATTFFGFIMLFSLFWGFGGWGTPPAAGPTQLPGQPTDELQPRWVPFAQDSRLAGQPPYEQVGDFPEGFQVFEGENQEEALAAVEQAISAGDLDPEIMNAIENSMITFDERISLIEDGADGIGTFFADHDLLTSELDEAVRIGLAANGRGELLMGATYQEFDEEAFEVVEDGETYTAFGYYEQGARLLPALSFFVIALILFALHAWLLDRDERLERRDRQQTEELEEPERVPEPA